MSSDTSGKTDTSERAKIELQTGTDLTRRGLLAEAIPHLLSAMDEGAERYASGVNLGICYLGLERHKEAISTLTDLRSRGYKTATVDNLLTQAYIGDGQTEAALRAFQEASSLTPRDEKLYDFVADACTDHHNYALGLRVTEIGLTQLPDSARLHYERGLFLARMDRLNDARPEFEEAVRLAPGSYIGYLAQVQEDLYDDKLPPAIQLLREAIRSGNRDYRTLSLLGTVLLQAGAAPGEPDFAEAQAALEESARDRPDYSATQIALGKLYIMEGKLEDARDHLEIARRLEPSNPAVYTNLAHVYRRLGDREKAQMMEAELSRLLSQKKTVSGPTMP